MDPTDLGVPATFCSPFPLFANRGPPVAPDFLKIQRVAHRQTAALENVGIDPRRPHVLVPQPFRDVRMSYPAWSRWVARECRKVCGVTRFGMPASRVACWTARCRPEGFIWWRRTLPLRGSTER
jgi:hypothetical protein